jgi:hypothetical protein
MATRHRIPTIFNLSMVDVLCCALGCVILLWLINLRDAKQRAEASGKISEVLARAQAQVADLEDEARASSDRLQRVTGERDDAARRLAELDKGIRALRIQQADTADRLAKKTKEQADLSKELTASRQRVETLDMLVREKDALAKSTARSAEDLAERLRDTDARLRQARSQADLVPGLREEVRTYRDKLAAAETMVAALNKEMAERKLDLAGAGKNLQDLGDANRRLEREVAAMRKQLGDADRDLASLREEKRLLADQTVRARAAADNRFAGIALTGRRVVFLVDMSGSMELVDENTPSPDKWVGVRQTLAKVMRSLPDLEKFQVVLFATKASYLLGKEGQWLDYDPVTSPGKVAEALTLIKPRGNTDMYAAFEAAFRFRAAGLDTIYLFSDGLPNVGAGLSPEAARNLKETDRAEILSKHVRRTLKVDWNRNVPGRPRVRINAIGFFYESPDVGAFLWALARENDGSFVGMSKP